ncbi:two-component system response regulator [Opitutaceae bacterium EW11]|nr:two-component system response regulator [Opitutaceae bacterium EW11]
MNPTVLTVDDSPSIRQMVGLTLRRAGCEVIEAPDGSAALETLKRHDIQLIVTDLNMPVMDGITLIRSVRADPRCRFLPILMLTTESEPAKKQEGRAAGATGWIVKPFTPEQLVAVVNKVLGRIAVPAQA